MEQHGGHGLPPELAITGARRGLRAALVWSKPE